MFNSEHFIFVGGGGGVLIRHAKIANLHKMLLKENATDVLGFFLIEITVLYITQRRKAHSIFSLLSLAKHFK